MVVLENETTVAFWGEDVDFPDMFVHSVPDVCVSQRFISLL